MTPYDAAVLVVEENQCPSCAYWDDGCNNVYDPDPEDELWCKAHSEPRRVRRAREPWWMDEDERWGLYGR